MGRPAMVTKKSARDLDSGLSMGSLDSHSPGFRIPPQAVEVEKHVVGALFLDAEAVGSALELLQGEDFYLEKHQVIFEAVQGLFERNTPSISLPWPKPCVSSRNGKL